MLSRLMALLTATARFERKKYGMLRKTGSSSDTCSDSRLRAKPKRREGVGQYASKNHGHAPEYGEHIRNTPDPKDLVLEHLKVLGLVAVYGLHTQR